MTKLHFLTRLYKRTDADGKAYYSGKLGNSQLLLFSDGEE